MFRINLFVDQHSNTTNLHQPFAFLVVPLQVRPLHSFSELWVLAVSHVHAIQHVSFLSLVVRCAGLAVLGLSLGFALPSLLQQLLVDPDHKVNARVALASFMLLAVHLFFSM